MADEQKRRGLTPEQWAEVRPAFEGGESILSLAKRFGVKRDTIAARRDREAWVIGHDVGHMPNREQQRVVRDRAQGQVIDIASRRVVEKLDTSGALDAMASDIARAVADNAPMVIKLNRLINLYADFALGEGKPESLCMRPSEKQSHADVLKALVGAMQIGIAATREVAGLRPGQSSAMAADGGRKDAPTIDWQDTDRETA